MYWKGGLPSTDTVCAGENKRILRHRGRVFAMAAEPDVARVWLPNEDVPGLAMSRSLGDAMVKRCGVSAEPEISHRAISGGDEFVVLASDGVSVLACLTISCLMSTHGMNVVGAIRSQEEELCTSN